ncbi:MAG: L,D-transpeptidase family protein [Candidatus Omnitrophica bacterium]|nr:L,D-transpeptidase family protein [Candidatus Omnitrophota bacterium]
MSLAQINWIRSIGLLGLCVFACDLSWGQATPVTSKSALTQESPSIELGQKAKEAWKKGELFAARSLYLKILKEFPDAENIQDVNKQLGNINVAIVRSPLRSRQTEIYTIQKGDTLGSIAQKMGTTIELIKIRNQLESNKITAGHRLSVWKGSFWIAIDKSDNVLALKVGDELIKNYQVSTGKNNSSPVGNFRIKYRYMHPVWFHKGDVVPADDPKNFLGTRWLGFDLPKYGIHGTIEPELIGQSVSSGCIRMRNEDVQELYDLIPMGTKVIITD